MTQKEILEDKIASLTEMLPVAEAFDNGKRVQIFQDDQWRDVARPSFDSHNQYRIKPESRELWVCYWNDNRFIYETKEAAEQAVKGTGLEKNIFKFVEEIEEGK